MKLWAFVGTALLACGCNQGDSVTQASQETALHGTGLLSQAGNSAGNTLSPRPHDRESGSEPQIASAQSTESDAIRVPDLSQILAPIAQGECFFSAPEQRKEIATESVAELKDNEPKNDSIRLLGFIQVGSGNTDRNQAILRIDGKLAYVSEGDLANDWEVLSISPPEVTLQRHRQRRSISLNDQPRSQPASTGRFISTLPNRNSGRNQRASRLPPLHPNTRAPGQSETRDIDPIQPDAAPSELMPPEPELPELPQLPELPELPDAPELPDDPLIDP